MADLVERLRASLQLDAVNGDYLERNVCARQMREAADEIVHLRAEAKRDEQWHKAALRVGEDVSSVGPEGYYAMTAEQWREWAIAALDRLRAECDESRRQLRMHLEARPFPMQLDDALKELQELALTVQERDERITRLRQANERLEAEVARLRAMWSDAAAVLRLPDLDNDGGPGDLAEAIRGLLAEQRLMADEIIRLTRKDHQ